MRLDAPHAAAIVGAKGAVSDIEAPNSSRPHPHTFVISLSTLFTYPSPILQSDGSLVVRSSFLAQDDRP